MTTEINPDELWARTQAYARRHYLQSEDHIGVYARLIADEKHPRSMMSGSLAVAYLAGYDQRQQEDQGPTLDRDAALIAFANGHLWRSCAEHLRQIYREKATAARIMVGGTYAD